MKRFTQRARRVLSLAQDEAEQLRHNYIGTEHLLIALIRDESSIAGRILRDLGLEQKHVQEVVERLTQTSSQTTQVQLHLSPDTKKTLEQAVSVAERMGQGYIGTEHLLLGLVRQHESVAVEVLKRLGVTPEEIRRQAYRVLQMPREMPREMPGQRPSRSARQAWEYLVVFIRDSDITDEEPVAAFADADRYTDQLNAYGKAGWELVSFHWTDNGGRAILKRPGYF